MRDQYDAQIWNDHHDAFAASVDDGLQAARRWLRRRFAPTRKTPSTLPSLIATLAAAAMTVTIFYAAAGPDPNAERYYSAVTFAEQTAAAAPDAAV